MRLDGDFCLILFDLVVGRGGGWRGVENGREVELWRSGDWTVKEFEDVYLWLEPRWRVDELVNRKLEGAG